MFSCGVRARSRSLAEIARSATPNFYRQMLRPRFCRGIRYRLLPGIFRCWLAKLAFKIAANKLLTPENRLDSGQ
jgi:hypothetical protein